MLPINKTNAHGQLVKKNKTVAFFVNGSLVLGVVLGVAFVIMTFIHLAFLFIGLVFLVAGLVMRLVCKQLFVKNCKEIVKAYNKAYNVICPSANLTYKQDNYGLRAAISSPHLLCWFDSNLQTLNFISNHFRDVEHAIKLDNAYKSALNSNFGVVSINIRDIDSYMLQATGDCVLVFSCCNNVCRLTVDTAQYFDMVIPTLEYHFKTAKKQEMNSFYYGSCEN
jgi:hypothetical protein